MPIAPDGTPLPYPPDPAMAGAPVGMEEDELAGEYGDIDDAPAGPSPMLAQILDAPPPDEATNALPMDEGALFEDVLSGIRELIRGRDAEREEQAPAREGLHARAADQGRRGEGSRQGDGNEREQQVPAPNLRGDVPAGGLDRSDCPVRAAGIGSAGRSSAEGGTACTQ